MWTRLLSILSNKKVMLRLLFTLGILLLVRVLSYITIPLFDTDQITRFINSSGSVIASDYDYARLSMTSHIAFAEIRSTTGTFVDDFFSGNSYNDGQSVGWVFNPYSSSSYTFALYQNMSASSTPYTWGQKGIAVLHQSTSCTGFQFLPSGATFTTGFIRTYGLRVDNG